MNNTEPNIIILMATYNGASYLEEQLDSIRKQTMTDWSMLIRDDGSTDNTLSIVEKLCREDKRISFLKNHRGNLGPAQCFSALLDIARKAGTPYFALADQDDYWNEDKLELQLQAIEAMETQFGRNVPLLAHTDLVVVDEQLHEIHPSFTKRQYLNTPDNPPLATLLVQNHVVGCTIMGNHHLLQAALPVPKDAYMHDWWLALNAKLFGHIQYLPHQTIKYRQHMNNQVGSLGFRRHLNPKNALHQKRRMDNFFSISLIQAYQLQRRLHKTQNSFQADERAVKELSTLLDLTEMPILKRFSELARGRIKAQNPLNTLAVIQAFLNPGIINDFRQYVKIHRFSSEGNLPRRC